MSLPAPPFRVSFPVPPSRVLLALLPVMILFWALPVPLIAVVPVKVRFTTFAGSVVVSEVEKVSVIVVVTVFVAPRAALIGLVVCQAKDCEFEGK